MESTFLQIQEVGSGERSIRIQGNPGIGKGVGSGTPRGGKCADYRAGIPKIFFRIKIEKKRRMGVYVGGEEREYRQLVRGRKAIRNFTQEANQSPWRKGEATSEGHGGN